MDSDTWKYLGFWLFHYFKKLKISWLYLFQLLGCIEWYFDIIKEFQPSVVKCKSARIITWSDYIRIPKCHPGESIIFGVLILEHLFSTKFGITISILLIKFFSDIQIFGTDCVLFCKFFVKIINIGLKIEM